MKPIQQRPFFQTATSVPGKTRLHLSRWIAAIMALLFVSCASLTPERVAVLTAIAHQAAQVGASDWLAKHPNHRDSFNAVIIALTALARNGNTNETAFVELISSLPTATLAGPEGELYVTEADLVIWDAQLKKAVSVQGPALQPVMRATLTGLRQAVAPRPPVPVPSGDVRRVTSKP